MSKTLTLVRYKLKEGISNPMMPRKALSAFLLFCLLQVFIIPVIVYFNVGNEGSPYTAETVLTALSHTFTLILVISILSSSIGSPVAALLSGGDIDYVFTAPVSNRQVFLANRIVWELWMIPIMSSILLSPFAVILKFGLPVWRGLLSSMSLFLFLDILALAGIVPAFLFQRSRKVSFRITGLKVWMARLLVIVFLILLVLSWQHMLPQEVLDLVPEVVSSLAWLESYMPSGLASQAAVGFLLRSGIPPITFWNLAFLFTIDIALNIIALWMSAKRYGTGMIESFESFSNVTAIYSGAEFSKKGKPIFSPIGTERIRNLITKDRTLLRSVRNFAGSLGNVSFIATALAIVSILGAPSLFIDVFSSFLIFSSLLVATSILGLEGDALYVLKSAPISASEVIQSKFLTILPNMYVSFIPLAVSNLETPLFLLTSAFLPPIICACAITAGTLKPEKISLKWSYPSVVTLVLSSILIILVSIPFTFISFLFFFILPNYLWASPLVLLPYSIFATLFLLRGAASRFDKLEALH